MSARRSLKRGAAVSWSASGRLVQGRIVRRLTAPIEIKGHHVAASPANPEYLVESDATGAQAAHQPDALHPAARHPERNAEDA